MFLLQFLSDFPTADPAILIFLFSFCLLLSPTVLVSGSASVNQLITLKLSNVKMSYRARSKCKGGGLVEHIQDMTILDSGLSIFHVLDSQV